MWNKFLTSPSRKVLLVTSVLCFLAGMVLLTVVALYHNYQLEELTNELHSKSQELRVKNAELQYKNREIRAMDLEFQAKEMELQVKNAVPGYILNVMAQFYNAFGELVMINQEMWGTQLEACELYKRATEMTIFSKKEEEEIEKAMHDLEMKPSELIKKHQQAIEKFDRLKEVLAPYMTFGDFSNE